MNCKKCGAVIPEKRVEFLKKFNRPITCIHCSDTGKVGGFVSVEGKTERVMVVADQQVIDELNRLDLRVRK